MKGRSILLISVGLVVLIAFSALISEISWASKERKPDPLRELAGLPSLSIGNLSPAARNPGLETLCTGLYDVPGGYCSYFTPGASFIGLRLGGNITAGDER